MLLSGRRVNERALGRTRKAWSAGRVKGPVRAESRACARRTDLRLWLLCLAPAGAPCAGRLSPGYRELRSALLVTQQDGATGGLQVSDLVAL